jgi:hypothetical protein
MRVRKAFVKMKAIKAFYGYKERQTWFGAFNTSMRFMSQLHTDTLSKLDAVDTVQTWSDYKNVKSTRNVLELLEVLEEATRNGAIKFVFRRRLESVGHTHAFVYNLPLYVYKKRRFYTGWLNKSFWKTCTLEVPHYGMAFDTEASLKRSVPWLFDSLGEFPDCDRMCDAGKDLVSVTGYTCPDDCDRWVKTMSRNGNVQFYPLWWIEETGGLVSKQSELFVTEQNRVIARACPSTTPPNMEETLVEFENEAGDEVGELPSMGVGSASSSSSSKKPRRRAGKKKQAKKELAGTRLENNDVGSSSSQLDPINEPEEEGGEPDTVHESDTVVELSSLLDANLTTQDTYNDVATSVATALACVVCFSNEKSVAMVPCGHRCVCTACAERFSGGGKCPMCRTTLTGVIRVFD